MKGQPPPWINLRTLKSTLKHTLCSLILVSAALFSGLQATPSDTLGTYLVDSSTYTLRSMDEQAMESLRQNPDFNYENRVPSLSWWERALIRFFEFLGRNRETTGSLLEILVYVIVIFALVVLIMNLAKLKVSTLFSKKDRALDLPAQLLEEDIHEMDLDDLVAEAVRVGAYRRAVRLLYLRSLKDLTQGQLIDWRPEKTNFDYRLELAGSPLARPFDKLSRSYEYIWYGEFPVDEGEYQGLAGQFDDFKTQIRAAAHA